MNKRTNTNFEKHKHRIQIFKCEEEEIRVDHFQIEKSGCQYIKFINTSDSLTVTGDYGNWIFCRPFIPFPGSTVSEMYWIEKLQMYSIQSFTEYDWDAINKEIDDLIDHRLEDIGYEGKDIEELKEWFRELREETDDEIAYLNKAFRDYYAPSCLDLEYIPTFKVMPIQLKIIFDAYEEISERMKYDVILDPGTKVRFRHSITEGSNEDMPLVEFVKGGDEGIIVEHQGENKYLVKNSRNDEFFSYYGNEFYNIGNEEVKKL